MTKLIDVATIRMRDRGLLTPEEARESMELRPKVAQDAMLRFAARANAGKAARYEIRNATEADDEDEAAPSTEVILYGEIDAYWGIDPLAFAEDFRAIESEQIVVRLNSPGGFVYDGIAIYNTIRDHPARVTMIVDALAASIASVIALAGDEVVMNRGAEMMIHDAWGLAIGNSTDMRSMADSLDRQNRKLAGIYQSRAGGTLDGWLDAMSLETWFSAAEAVDVGLADRAIESDEAKMKAKAMAQGGIVKAGIAIVGDDGRAADGFRYAGRAAAPAPKIATSETPDQTPTPSTAATAESGSAASARLRSSLVVARAKAALVLAEPLTESDKR